MSIILTGDPTTVSAGISATVTALANNGSGAIRVTTSASHLFGQGDLVNMNASPALGFFNITVIDSTHFDLVGSTFTTTGTGSAVDLSLTPQVLVPTDGDTGSLQLSGFVSAFQAVLSRTQKLRNLIADRAMSYVQVTSSGTIQIPSFAQTMIIRGWGSGGGGGGGAAGTTGTFQGNCGGGGGAGARAGMLIYPVSGNTALDVVIGAGVTGGAGGTPPGGDGGAGNDGNASTVAYHSGSHFANFLGGAGGGGASNHGGTLYATNSTTPIFTPGGSGPAYSGSRGGPSTLVTQTSPGPQQLINIVNSSGTISATAGWSTSVYNNPVGTLPPNAGGPSVANGGNATYSGATSYAGAPDASMAYVGGNGGGNGSNSSSYIGGAGGGGGGAGPGAGGSNGGAGGAANSSGSGVQGSDGSHPAPNTGAGGGGAGAGGAGSTGGGIGGIGGSSGSGYVEIIFIGTVTTP